MPTYRDVVLDAVKKFQRQQDERNLQIYVSKLHDKSLSSNDFTAVYRNKLEGIEDNAEVNAVSAIKIGNATQPVDDHKTAAIKLTMAAFLNDNIADDNDVSLMLDNILGRKKQ